MQQAQEAGHGSAANEGPHAAADGAPTAAAEVVGGVAQRVLQRSQILLHWKKETLLGCCCCCWGSLLILVFRRRRLLLLRSCCCCCCHCRHRLGGRSVCHGAAARRVQLLRGLAKQLALLLLG